MPHPSFAMRRSLSPYRRLLAVAGIGLAIILGMNPLVPYRLAASALGVPVLIVTPTQTLPGGALQIVGEGFPKQQPGQVRLDGSAGTGPTYHADAYGNFTHTLTVPPDAIAGTHQVMAFAQNNGLLATTPIEVLAVQPGVPSPTPVGTPSESPTPTDTATPTPADTPSPTPTPAETPSPTPTPAETPSPTPTPAETPSPTPTPAETPSPTPTPTPTPAPTPTPTPTPASGGVTFVGAGDIAGSATSNQIINIPGTVYTVGDNAYPDGSTSDFNANYDPTWGRFKSRTMPVPGNHDYHQTNASGYRGYFGYTSSEPLYYSYDVGSWHIVALDSGNCDTSPSFCAAGSTQEQWLKADLAAHATSCVLAYWHHPRFTSGSEHAPDLNVQAFWNDLYAADADVVLGGHNHQYERFAPQSPTGAADASRGIREFVVGTGGSGLYGFGTAKPNSEVRYSATHGVLELTLRDGGYDWNFRPSSGSFADTGSDNCH